MNEIPLAECVNSYMSALSVAEMPYIDPYVKMVMFESLDLEQIRNGEWKYLIRRLYKKRYPGVEILEKIPMPRPVDFYFKDWKESKRYEFRQDINLSRFTGN